MALTGERIMQSFGWPNELRVLLTNRCNYNCVFCHKEGQNDLPHSEISPGLLDTILKGLDSGILDITFTGGEPLLRKDVLLEYVGKINEATRGKPAKITIVTNASLMDEEFTAGLSQHKNITLNVSLHTFDGDTYKKITRQSRFSVDRIVSRLANAKREGLDFKINAVLLRGINNEREQVASAIAKAREIGARAIKFIELLVPNTENHLIPYYYEIDAIGQMLQDELLLEEKDHRRARYRLRTGDGFYVELARCTCAVGCAKCTHYRPFQVNCSNGYQPCFVSIAKLPLEGAPDLKNALTEGNKKIASFAERFGEESPTLHNRVRFTGKLFSVFCEVEDDFYDLLTQHGADYGIEKIRFVHQDFFFYLPRTGDRDWSEFRRVVRIRRNHFNVERDVLIISNNASGRHGDLFFMSTDFAKANNFFMEDAPETLRDLLNALDFREAFAYTRVGYQFIDVEEHNARHEISRLEISGTAITIYSCSCVNQEKLPAAARLVRQFNLRVITQPFFGYLWKIAKGYPTRS